MEGFRVVTFAQGVCVNSGKWVILIIGSAPHTSYASVNLRRLFYLVKPN